MLGLTAAARAEGFSAVVSAASNYAYRGYSKSANSWTARANLDYSHRSGWFVGGWVARVDFGDAGYPDRSNVEFYPYAGLGFTLSRDWRGEIAVARYVFDGRIFGQYSDYNEYSAALHYSDWLTVKLNFSDDGYHRGGSILDGEIVGRYPLMANLSASAGIGYNHIDVSLSESALYWNLGLTWYFKYAALDVRYVDSADVPSSSAKGDEPTLPGLRQNFMATVSVGF